MKLQFKKIGTILLSALFIAGGILAADVTPTAKPAVKKAAVKTISKAKAAATAVPAETAVPEAITPQAASQAQTVAAFATPAADTATAQGALSFDDCYKLAAEHNRDYKMAGLDKAVAEAQLSKATGMFGPTISVAGGWEPQAKSSLITLAPNTPFNPTANPLQVNLIPTNVYAARVSLSQPVFTFGKTVLGYKMAEEGYKIAQLKFKQASEKLNLDVINSFYGALIAQQMSQTMQETLKSNEEYFRITKTKYANGQASNFDVLQAQVQYSNAIPDALKAADGARLAMQMLKNTIGLPLDKDITLTGAAEYKKLDMTYADMEKQFKEKNDDREIINSATNISNLNKDMAVAMLLPNVAISANYNYYSTDAAFHRESWDWQSSWDITLGFQWTIFDSFKNVAAIKEACANSEKAELNKENVNNMLEIQMDSLYTSLEQNRQVIEAAGDLIKTAEEGYRIAKESYKNGLIQSVDLLNAENGLLKAKMNYLGAMFNYITTAQKLKDFLN